MTHHFSLRIRWSVHKSTALVLPTRWPAFLSQRILNGELRPGTPLQEIPLAESLGVSRNTMREATRILSLEGLLKRSIHRGIAVAQLSLEMCRRSTTSAGCLKSLPSWRRQDARA